jgi:hypothetical protein
VFWLIDHGFCHQYESISRLTTGAVRGLDTSSTYLSRALLCLPKVRESQEKTQIYEFKQLLQNTVPQQEYSRSHASPAYFFYVYHYSYAKKRGTQ